MIFSLGDSNNTTLVLKTAGGKRASLWNVTTWSRVNNLPGKATRHKTRACFTRLSQRILEEIDCVPFLNKALLLTVSSYTPQLISTFLEVLFVKQQQTFLRKWVLPVLFSRNNATLNFRLDVFFFFNVFRTQQVHKQGKVCTLYASYNNHMMVITCRLYIPARSSVRTHREIYQVQLVVEECRRSKEKKNCDTEEQEPNKNEVSDVTWQ